MNLTAAKPTMMSLVGEGLDGVNRTLQSLFDSGSTDVALINALTMLGSQYTFDQMRINRAEITAIDNDPATTAILGELDAACASLGKIQARSAATTAWITTATGVLDDAMAVYTTLAKPIP